jgi:hypothetical protein
MKTAVEWLIEQIENNVHHTIRIPREFFDQAKEMEKEQMKNGCDEIFERAKEIDNETFKQQEQ